MKKNTIILVGPSPVGANWFYKWWMEQKEKPPEWNKLFKPWFEKDEEDDRS